LTISDQVSSSLIKPNIGRLRPCADILAGEGINLLVKCGSGKSFPSTHAANHFTIAVFLITCLGKNIKWFGPFLLFWATLVSFAQVYVGLHFPLDVIAGCILGVTIGIWSGYLVMWMVKHLPESNYNRRY
ncbi:MAG: phosphatase PAP2 family protein, partial [Bacteroidota bacterium]|nr:phosphatase PAP2 family protein [Bacteroidota bacterium]